MKKILTVFGTRPEAIKMSPLILSLKKETHFFEVKTCVTAQHREMLDQVLGFFGIIPDYDLDIMKPNQSLSDITINSLHGIEKVLIEYKPDLVFVQGDTTTTFVASLAAYYHKIKIAHLEAGLRSGNKFSPFPEEVNRKLTGHLADLHFAPTPGAAKNLKAEGISENTWMVGNTVIDAIFLGMDIIKSENPAKYEQFFKFIDFSKKIILVTGHRRESFGKPFRDICFALKRIATENPDVSVVYPVHLNPNVQAPVKEILRETENIHLLPPLEYPYLLYLMARSYLVLTDSGGIQEEAPSLGKPVLVMRDVTERTEGIEAGTARLVGSDSDLIFSETSKLLYDHNRYEKMSRAVNPYGDGKTSIYITNILKSIEL